MTDQVVHWIQSFSNNGRTLFFFMIILKGGKGKQTRILREPYFFENVSFAPFKMQHLEDFWIQLQSESCNVWLQLFINPLLISNFLNAVLNIYSHLSHKRLSLIWFDSFYRMQGVNMKIEVFSDGIARRKLNKPKSKIGKLLN